MANRLIPTGARTSDPARVGWNGPMNNLCLKSLISPGSILILAASLATAAASAAPASPPAPAAAKPAETKPPQSKPAPSSAPLTRPPVLTLPIACEPGVTCVVQNYVDINPGSEARDWHCGTRTYHEHNGIDFRILSLAAQRAGTNVLAAADGTVKRLRDGEPDISVRERGVANLDGRDCGNGVVIDHGRGWTTQYCHMARGSIAVKEGQPVKAGQPVGRVGLSGRTEYPHLHFTLRSGDTVLEPFAVDLAPGTCGVGHVSAWAPVVAAKLAYAQRAVLVAGFADGPVNDQAVDEGTAGVPAPDTASAALVVYVRALGLRRGDVQRFTITGPDGKTWLENRIDPLPSDKAQVLYFMGRKKPQEGFAPGPYSALYEVLEADRPVFSRTITLDLKAATR